MWSRCTLKLAKRFHPDNNPETGDAEIFLRIAEAYRVLSDPAEAAGLRCRAHCDAPESAISVSVTRSFFPVCWVSRTEGLTDSVFALPACGPMLPSSLDYRSTIWSIDEVYARRARFSISLQLRKRIRAGERPGLLPDGRRRQFRGEETGGGSLTNCWRLPPALHQHATIAHKVVRAGRPHTGVA